MKGGGAVYRSARFAVLVAILASTMCGSASAQPTFQLSFGSYGSGNGQFEHPAGLASDNAGHLWVVDEQNNRVQEFNDEGEYLGQFGTAGSEPGQFSRPTAVAIDPEGDLWVADAGNNRIEKFSNEGELLEAVGSSGSGIGQFSGPEGIAIDPEGNLWVADTYNGRVQEFDPEGEFVQAVGSYGSGEGQLGEPTDVDIAPNGDVWIADWQNNRVAVFDEEGEFVRQFGSSGWGNGQFNRPDAIDVDAEGNVWVGDQNNDRIQRFDETGEYLGQFGSGGSGPGEFSFSYPFGVEADESGHLWIADANNGRVQRWRIHEELTCGERSVHTDVDQPLVLEPGELGFCEGEGPLEYEIVSGPEHGTITEFDPETGALTYTPDSEYLGLDLFTFEVHNAKESVGPTTFRLEVGDGPECQAGESSTGLETSLPIELSCGGSPPLEYEIVSGPEHGEITELDPEAGTLTYAPDSEFAGFDSFGFAASNALGISPEAGFQIAVGDPAGCEGGEASTRWEEPLPIELSCGGSPPLEYEIVSGPEHGEITELNPETGALTYVPDPEYFGPDRFEFAAVNPLGPSATASFDVEVGNNDPIAAYAFDEEGGEVARDSIGGHDASVHGAERSAVGRFGAAFDFDGEADRLTVPGASAFNLGGEFTFEAWVRPAESHAWSPLLVDEDTSETVPYSYALYSRGEGVGPAFYVAEGESTTAHVEAAEGLPAGEWSHLAVTSDGEDLRLYVNGELKDTIPTLSAKAAGGDLQIGGSPALGQYFKGRIDEVRAYDRALSPTEIAKDRDRSVLDGFGASISGVAAWGQFLAADPGVWPGSGRATFEYQWLLCNEGGGECEAIEGARRREYRVTYEDIGHTFRVLVNAGPGSRASVRSAPTQPVTEGDPEAESAPQIFGHVAQGKLLSILEGEWFPETATLTRQWRRCDPEGGECKDIAGAEADRYVPQAADVGATLRVAVTATSSGGSTTEVSEPTEPVAAALIENTAAPTFTESYSEFGTMLVAQPGTWTAAGEIAYGYRWLRCDAEGGDCHEVEEASEETYIPSDDDLGSTLRVHVTATVDGEREAANSGASSVLKAAKPVSVVAPVVSGQARAGSTLEGTRGTWDGIGLSGLKAQWQVCDALGEACEALAGAEDDEELELSSEEMGSTIRLEIIATNGAGSTAAQSTPTAVVAGPAGVPPALISPPSISGLPEVGEELGGSTGVWSGATEYSYQWERCDIGTPECTPIAGAVEPAYVPTPEDVGFLLRLVVTAFAEDEASSSAGAESSQSIRVAGGPANTEAPSIEGAASVGTTLSVSHGTWTGEPINFKYRWQRCDSGGCSPIPGATGGSHKLTTADARQTLRVAVTAENAKGKTIALTSQTGEVDPVVPFEVTTPTVSGGSRVGETLNATSGTWDGEAPIAFAYAWLRCDSAGAGCSAISGAEGSSYELKGTDVGHSVRVSVTATNLAGEAEVRSQAGTPISAAAGPVSTAPPAIMGETEAGQTLTVSNGSWEGAETYAYQWQRCGGVLGASECVNISGATKATYTAGYDDARAALRVALTATGPSGEATAVSKATGEVQPSLLPGQEEDSLANTSLPTLSGEAQEGQVLTVTSGSWSSYLPVSFEYAWWRCHADGTHCVAIEGADEASYALQADDVGGTVRGAVRAGNGSRAKVVASRPSDVIAQAKPSNESLPSVVSLEGNGAIDGEVLVAEVGSWFGSDLEFAFQWQACDAEGKECEDIEGAGAQEETFAIDSDQIASTLRVVVTATNEAGSASAGSAVSKAVVAAPPEYASSPGIYGEAYEEGTLEVTKGDWSGSPELTFSYQWQRCNEEGEECEAISGANAASYVAVNGDVGSRLRVVVTVSNEAGSGEAISELSEIIAPAFLPQLAGSVPITEGFPYVGRTLSAEPGEWEGHEPIEFSYQWQRCNEEGEECADIPAATGQTYLTTSGDLGARIRVEVTATNSSGETKEDSEVGEAITAAAPLNESPPAIAEGVHRVGSELESSTGSWAGSGPLEFDFAWERCNEEEAECEEVPGETAATYTAIAEDARKTVRSVVTATGPLGSESQAAEAVRVLPPVSVNLVAPSVSGSPLVGETLAASSGEWAPEPDEFTYQWQRCSSDGDNCGDISGEEGSEYSLSIGDAGATIRAVVDARNIGEEEAPSEPSEVTEVIGTEAPLNVTAPTLSANPPILSEKILANPGLWVGDDPITFHYEWQSCWSAEAWTCEDIGNMTNTFGAHTSAFTSTYDLYHSRFRVEVTAENSHGSAVAYSSLSKPAEFEEFKSPPENVYPPSLSGHAVVGSTLSIGRGIWSAADELVRGWQRCDAEGESCSTISAFHGEHYSPSVIDIGHTVRGTLTGLNGLGEQTVVTEPSEVVISATEPENLSAPEISGTPEVGQALFAIDGEWGGSEPINYDYLWKRCDTEGRNCTPIDDETYLPWEHLLTRADVGATMRLQVTATNGWGSVSATSRPTKVVPPAPPIANLHTASWYWWRTPEFGELYRVPNLGRWESEPEVSYQWQRCDPLTGEGEEMECSDISGATDPEGYVPQAADVGFRLRLEETGTVPGETVHAFSEPAPGEVEEELKKGKASYAGVTVPGQKIKASSGIAPSAGLPTSTEYRFFRLGEEGPEELQAGASSEYEIGGGDLGHRIKVEMTVSVLRADEASVLQSTEVQLTTSEVEVALTNDTPPEISGEAVDGATLHAEPGSWHGGGGALTRSYKWRRCDEEGESCVDISGATHSDLLLKAADIGSALRVVETVSSGPLETSASSEPYPLVEAATAPESEEQPAISGELVELGMAEGAPGVWSGSEPVSYSYRWQGCASEGVEECLDIEGATEPNLPLDRLEVGQWLRLIITAANAGGSSIAASELVGPVEQAPGPQLSSLPSLTILGPAAVGSTVVTDGGAWQDVDESELEYQWLRCDEEGEDCEEIESANDSSYLLGDEDAGSLMEVEVTGENSTERLSATSEPSPLIGEFEGSAAGSVVYLDEARESVFLGEFGEAEETGEEAEEETGEEAEEETEGEADEEIANCQSLVDEEECTLSAPRIAPGGEMIAVGVEADAIPGEEPAVMLMNFDGSEPRLLGAGIEPKWSEDGTGLYFTVRDLEEEEEGPWKIVEVAADGSDALEPQTVFESSGEAGSTDLSPDGESIIYAQTEPAAKPQFEWDKTWIYLAKLQGTPKKIDLGPNIASAFDPRFSADGSEIIFTAIPTNPKVVHYGEELLPLYGDLHRLWAMNSNGTNPHPIVPEETVTYGPPAVVGNEVLASQETATWVSAGDGGFIQYSDPTVWRLSTTGGDPKETDFRGVEPYSWGHLPDWIHPKPPDVTDCPRGVHHCEPWNGHTKYLAAQYAYKYSEEDQDGPNFRDSEHYWTFGSNCTSFVSQAWHAAGQRFMYEFYPKDRIHVPRDGLIWWGGKAYETEEESKYNESFTNVNGLAHHMTESGRARILKPSETTAANLKTGDIILIDWGDDGEYNHAVIVNESSDHRYISSEASNRHGIPWSEYVGKQVANYLATHKEWHNVWGFRILRPTYRAANIPPKNR